MVSSQQRFVVRHLPATNEKQHFRQPKLLIKQLTFSTVAYTGVLASDSQHQQQHPFFSIQLVEEDKPQGPVSNSPGWRQQVSK